MRRSKWTIVRSSAELGERTAGCRESLLKQQPVRKSGRRPLTVTERTGLQSQGRHPLPATPLSSAEGRARSAWMRTFSLLAGPRARGSMSFRGSGGLEGEKCGYRAREGKASSRRPRQRGPERTVWKASGGGAGNAARGLACGPGKGPEGPGDLSPGPPPSGDCVCFSQ